MTDSRNPAESSGGGERAIWVLIVGLFALGVLAFVTSFGGDGDSTAAANPSADDGDTGDAGDGATDENGEPADGTPPADGAATTPAAANTADRFTISASGDILIHERVAEAAATAAGYDFDPLFAPVQNLIASRDFAICHLEVPISSTNTDLSFSQGVFRAPTELADALSNAGFDSCSVASNHSWDSGEASVTSTIEQLQRVGLSHVGIANTSPGEAGLLWQFNVLGNTVGHLSYTFGLNGREPGEVPADRVAQIDEQRILADAAQQRAAGSEFTIVSMHWGTEFQNAPDDQQVDLGPRLLASPDIDLIIGHHAHVPQPVVAIDGEYIAYGLGNLLSNQAQGIPECPTLCPIDSQDGVLLDFVVERGDDGTLGVTEVIANPTWVDNRNTWRVIATDAPAAIGAEVDTAVLQASGQRTRDSLAIQ